MKKNRIFFFLTLAIVMVAMLSACSTEEVISGGAKKHQLTISVKDGLFTSQPETRTSPSGDNGLGTIFTINDKIGIFGVKGGEVKVFNVCYTSDGHLWNGAETIEYDPEATYYAYYPWLSDDDLKAAAGVDDVNNAVVPTATAADEFFKPLIDNWQPKMDQSLIESYNASDLMVGEGTAPTGEEADRYTMSFTMNHQMALCLTTLEEINFIVDANYSFKLMPNYKFTGDVKPCYYQNKFRYIVKPENNRVLKVSNGEETYTVNYFVKKKGNYTEHVVGGCDKEYQPRVGDIFYSDGSMTHGDEISIYKKQIGIVGYVTTHTDDPMLNGYSHGLVIAGLGEQLGGGGSVVMNDAAAINIMSSFGYVDIYCYNDAFKNYQGLKVTQKMEEEGIKPYGGGTYSTMGDWLNIINQMMPLNNNATKAPNSGWFVPGSAQSYQVINALYMANGGQDINLEAHGTEDWKTQVPALGLKQKINLAFSKLGSGHFEPDLSYVFSLSRTGGTGSSTRAFAFALGDDIISGTNMNTKLHPFLAF